MTPRGSRDAGAILDFEPAHLDILTVLSSHVLKSLQCGQNQYDCDNNTYAFHVRCPSPHHSLYPIVITKPVPFCYSLLFMNLPLELDDSLSSKTGWISLPVVPECQVQYSVATPAARVYGDTCSACFGSWMELAYLRTTIGSGRDTFVRQ